jgi:HNH endonuclease
VLPTLEPDLRLFAMLSDDNTWQRFQRLTWTAGGRDAHAWWVGAISDGYGRFRIGSRRDGTGRIITAHRYAYMREHGPIPASVIVRHLCDETLCTNAGHLLDGDPAENLEDYLRRRHRAHHPLSDIRGAAGRARAIRDAIRTSQRTHPNNLTAQRAAVAAAIADGDAHAGQLTIELGPIFDPLSVSLPAPTPFGRPSGTTNTSTPGNGG